MSPVQLLFTFALVAIYTVPSDAGESRARGFNDNIDWKNLDDGLEIAKKENKMAMVLIHKTWCGACKALKKRFPDSKEIEEEAQKFVMINLQDDEEPKDEKYKPDGGYIPRILFLNSQGEVMKDVYNKGGNENYKYYYADPSQIAKTMKSVLNKQGGADDDRNEL